MKPFLILQLRPIDLASDNEFEAFLKYGGLRPVDVHRVRMEKEGIPKISLEAYSGIILGGGPSNVSDHELEKSPYQKRFESDLHHILQEVFLKDYPFLGTCYGIGALAKFRNTEVSKENYSEAVGVLNLNLTDDGLTDNLTSALPKVFKAFGGHKEACQYIPDGATLLASSQDCPVQMIRFKNNIYGTQFHTELDLAGLILRINVYKDHGYFSPDAANELIEESSKHDVTYPMKILRNFVDTYKVD